jgi:hypothetical protein
MRHEYDIFEQRPAGAVWRASVPGIHNEHRKLAELAECTSNECFAIALATRQIVARVNAANLDLPSTEGQMG